MHSFPFSVQSCLRSWPFCPYPISWCIFSESSKPCAVAYTEVFLCCWHMWVKEESFENTQRGILPGAKWKGFTELGLFSLMSDQSKLIFIGNTRSANIATPAPLLLYPDTQRSIWKAVVGRDSINLCYNKGQRRGFSDTQLRSRGMIDVSLHSTSAWKEALGKQIACSQNILRVQNCPNKPQKKKKHKYFLVSLNDICPRWKKYHFNVYATWLMDELNKSVSPSCKSVSWRTSCIFHWPLSVGEKASGQW